MGTKKKCSLFRESEGLSMGRELVKVTSKWNDL
jgi:hypothetical protein